MKMLDAIDKGESPTIMGDGSEAFDFVAVEDCALANICAMKSDAVDSFYNVGTGKRTSLKELAEKLLILTGCPNPIQFAPRSQATLVRNRVGSAKKASAEKISNSSIDRIYNLVMDNGAMAGKISGAGGGGPTESDKGIQFA
jgi:UDP-glucose 4-epimerase